MDLLRGAGRGLNKEVVLFIERVTVVHTCHGDSDVKSQAGPQG